MDRDKGLSIIWQSQKLAWMNMSTVQQISLRRHTSVEGIFSGGASLTYYYDLNPILEV